MTNYTLQKTWAVYVGVLFMLTATAMCTAGQNKTPELPSYLVKMQVFEVHANGDKDIVTTPTMRLPENFRGSCFVGGRVAVMTPAGKKEIDIGTYTTVRIFRRRDKTLCVDLNQKTTSLMKTKTGGIGIKAEPFRIRQCLPLGKVLLLHRLPRKAGGTGILVHMIVERQAAK